MNPQTRHVAPQQLCLDFSKAATRGTLGGRHQRSTSYSIGISSHPASSSCVKVKQPTIGTRCKRQYIACILLRKTALWVVMEKLVCCRKTIEALLVSLSKASERAGRHCTFPIGEKRLSYIECGLSGRFFGKQLNQVPFHVEWCS